MSARSSLCLALCVTSLAIAPGALAQRAPRASVLPTGIAQRPLPPPMLWVRRAARRVPLELAALKIDARVVGHLAETTLTMTFSNPNNAVFEGDLVVPLPEGATVSSYGLDIRGRMVDGVVVDKDEGRQVFEKEVRKGIDPGLVEWTRGNNFRTRVFPIPAKGSRTIRLGYVSEVLADAKGESTYHLPLTFKKKVGSLELRIEVVKAPAKPRVLQGGPTGLSFNGFRDSYVASSKVRNVTLDKDLYVSLPSRQSRPVQVQRAPDGGLYFALRDAVVRGASPTLGRPARIGLYWDASLSRRQANVKEELGLLSAYLQSLGSAPVTLYLTVLRNRASKAQRFELPRQRRALLAKLRTLPFDGATQLGAIKSPARVDLNLLFSDGLSNLGKEDPLELKAPVYAINSSTSAGHPFLRYLALRTGGAYFNLRRSKAQEIAAAIGKPVFSFISAEVSAAPGSQGKALALYPRLRSTVQRSFDLAGKLQGKAAVVTLRYGYGSRVTHTKRYTVSAAAATQGTLLARYWAQKKIADLLVFPERNAEAISALGKRHGVVTPRTSLIVLETLAQYLEHQIRPPKMLAKMRASWDRAMARRAQQKKRQESSKLAHVLALWKKRVAWWSKRYTYPKNYRYQSSRPKKARRARNGRHRPSARPANPARRSEPTADLSAAFGARPALAKEKKKNGSASPGRPQPTIAMKPWDPKTPYLAALEAAPKQRRYAVYLEQRKKHGSAPAYYLDCAHFFRRQGQKRLALRILSNLAELELENPALLRILAHRLTQIGELDLAIQVFETVRKLRPEEPQSYRDLALVLERRADTRRGKRQRGLRGLRLADYRRALELLATVVMRRWDRFDAIEVIALTELNTILPKARTVGLKQLPVDKRLVKRLTMDVRIVMSWDADNTDMDLHVVEPSGEEAYYGHNRTRIGGLVSRDFTRGYGPEVYALRRAMPGTYTIRTKYFGSSAAKLAGAVTLQVDVYTNYGRRNQRRRSMTLRLTKSKETFTVAKIKF